MSCKAEARLFITLWISFRVVNSLLTNFHLPRSTLLALVSALPVVNAYWQPIGMRWKGDIASTVMGDCMLIAKV